MIKIQKALNDLLCAIKAESIDMAVCMEIKITADGLEHMTHCRTPGGLKRANETALNLRGERIDLMAD